MVSKFPSLLSLTERPGESDDKPALAAAPFPAGYHHRYILQVIICDVEDPAPYLPSLHGLIRRALHPGDILSLTDTSAGLFSISQPFTIQRQGETPPSSAPAGGRITLWEALASSLSAALTTIPAFPSDHLEFLCLVGHSEESDAAVDDSAARRVAALFGAASTAKLTCVYLPPPSGPLSITQSQLQTVFHQPPHAHHACSDTTSLSVANALVLFRKSLTGAREAHITVLCCILSVLVASRRHYLSFCQAKIRGLVPTIQSCSPSQSVSGRPASMSHIAM